MSSSRRVTRSAAAAVRAATQTTLPPVVFREPIAIPADSDSSSESEDNAVADPIEFASPPTLALPPPAEVTPTPAPLPEEQIAGESAGPVSGSPSDSPPLREQLAELLRLGMDQLLSPYNTRKIQTIAAILLSFRTLPCLRLRGLYLNASRSSLLSTTASF